MDYSTAKVANPKLTLYAFHLYKNLANDSKPVNNSNHLWHKCQEIGKKLGIPKLENLSIPKDKQILDQNNLDFTAIKHKNNLHLSGEIKRLQIHDTFALDLTFRYPHPKVQLTDLKGLNQDNCLLPSNINASLGQILVFFAQPVGTIKDEEAFAEHCVKALISEAEFNKLKISFQSKGKLLNSPIFEYNNDAVSPKNQCHILIWLNSNGETTNLENTGEYYRPLIDLLNCRSKIIYARSESRWCYQQARKEYSLLEDKVIQFNQVKNKSVDDKLKEFNQWLNEIPEISFNYASHLRDLELQRNTIKANTINYQLHLDKIKAICIQDDLEFLSSFLELAKDTFIEQINTDLAYLTPAQSLFEQLIESIRGIVEIEQTKREQRSLEAERNLNNTVQILGIGLGGGAIVSGVVTQHIDKINKPLAAISPNNPPHPFYASLFISIAATLFFTGVGWLIANTRKS